MRKIIFLLCLLLTACAPEKQVATDDVIAAASDKIYVSNEIITNVQIRTLFNEKMVYCSDSNYAIFNSNYLSKWHDKFLLTIFGLGITGKWRPEFDCDNFVMMKAAVGQTLYVSHSFHDAKPAEGLAIGELWYLINGNAKRGHAINVLIEKAENGDLKVKYVDIYTGKYMELSDLEYKSIFLIKF